MKKYLLIILMFISFAAKAQIDELAELRAAPGGKYSLMIDTLLRVGFRVKNDTIGRNQIDSLKRGRGMWVWTLNNSGTDGVRTLWELQTLSSQNGSNWKDITFLTAVTGLLNRYSILQPGGFYLGSSNGYIRFDPTATNATLEIKSTGMGIDPNVDFGNTNKVTGNATFGIIYDGIGQRFRTSGGIDRMTILSNGNVGIGNSAPSYPFSVTPFQYATGTVSQSGTTITGIGTTFTSAMVGSHIVLAQNGDGGLITGFTDATHLTAANSNTYASQAYTISYNALNVTNNGHVLLGVTPTNASGTNPSLVLVNGEIQQQVITAGGGIWGTITGSLSSQTDLQTALNNRIDLSTNQTASGDKTFLGFTKSKYNFQLGDNIATSSPFSYFFGDSETVGFGLTDVTKRFATQVSYYTSTTEVNKGISGTRMQQVTAGDSAMIGRYTTNLPTHTTGNLVFGYGTNDYVSTSCDTGIFRSNYNTVLTYANGTRGWAYNKIIMLSPVYRRDASGITYLSKGVDYKNVTADIARIKGCLYVDIYTYFTNKPRGTYYQADSVHFTAKGHTVVDSLILNVLKANGNYVTPILNNNGISYSYQGLYIGDATPTVTSAIRSIDFGTQIISTTAYNDAKIKLFNNGNTSQGIAIDANLTNGLMFYTGTGGLHKATFDGDVTATSFKKPSGVSTKFLKEDGSSDATVYAPLASPGLTGVPTAPTATAGNNTTQIASTAFVTAAVAAVPAPTLQNVTAAGNVTTKQITTAGNYVHVSTGQAQTSLKTADGDSVLISRDTTLSAFTIKNKTTSAGGIGNATRYANGSSQYFSFNDAGFLTSMSSGTFSVSVLFKTSDATLAINNILSWGGSGTSVFLSIGNTGVVTFGSSGSSLINSGTGFNNGAWHQAVITIGGGSQKLYLDGSLTGTSSSTNTIILTGLATNQSINGTNFYPTISIDQLLVYNSTLPAGVGGVSTLWNSGACTSSPPLASTNLIRRYDFEEGSGSTVADGNTVGTTYVMNLFNSPAWVGVGNGKVPTNGTNNVVIPLTVKDGALASTSSQTLWGDLNEEHINQGLDHKTMINGNMMLHTDLSGATVSGVFSSTSTVANPAAQFEVNSSTKGFLPPGLTTTAFGAIASKPEGLYAMDLTLHTPTYYDGTTVRVFANLAGIQQFANKTIGSSNILGGVTMTLGSDANYDMYYRNASGILTRLPNGTTGQLLSATTSSAPSWITANTSNVGIYNGNFTATGTATTTFTVTIGTTIAGAAYAVNVTPTDALAAGLFYVTNKTTTTFDVVYLSGLTGSVTFDWTVLKQ